MHTSPGSPAAPSPTALLSAAARAAHRLVDEPPLLLDDPLTERLLGSDGAEAIDYHRHLRHEPVLASARVGAAVRQRLVEDELQRTRPDVLVLLGAGLDTTGLRHAATGARVVEVDLPATQRWKRRALARAGLDVPPSLHWVEADLSTTEPDAALRATGLTPPPDARTLVSWLGVSMYLDEGDVERTLTSLAGLGSGTTLVMDHVLDPGSRDDAARRYADAVSAMAGQAGEPWRWTASVAELDALLGRTGWAATAHLTEREAAGERAWAARSDGLVPGSLAVLTLAQAR
jgi:methyltransferase (TIGR00027 family)